MVVAEKDGSFVSAFPVSVPGWLGVDRRGNIYTIHKPQDAEGLKVSVFSPQGEFLRTVIHNVPSRALFGPRIDTAGNIYIALAIYPPGRLYPEELDPHVTAAGEQAWYAYLYGSVLKFGPSGGGIWPPDATGQQVGTCCPAGGFAARFFVEKGRSYSSGTTWRVAFGRPVVAF